MKFENWTGIRVLVAVICLAALFFACAAQAQETTERVTVYDVDRTYMVRLPKGYDPAQKYPVVILLHGMNQEAADMEHLTRFDELADKSSIIAVYPSALQGRWNLGWEVAGDAVALGFRALADIRAEASDRGATKNRARLHGRMTSRS